MAVIDFEKFKKERRGGPILPAVPSGQAPAPVPEFDPAENGRQRFMKEMRELREAALRQVTEVKKFRRTISYLKNNIARLEKNSIRFDNKIRQIPIKRLRRSSRNLVNTMGSFLSTRRV